MKCTKEILKYLNIKNNLNMASVVDGTWSCNECGAWNAEWLTTCGRCEKEKETV